MDRVRLPGTNIEISALWLGVAEINVRQTEADAYRRNVVSTNGAPRVFYFAEKGNPA